MVDVGLFQSLSYLAAAIGVCVAAFYYVSILRNAEREKRRQTIMMRLLALNKEYYENYFSLLLMQDWRTPEEFMEKYRSNPDVLSKIMVVMNFYNTIGTLYMDGLMGIEDILKIASPYACIGLFERFWFFILLNRKNNLGEDMVPEFFVPFEYLYREMKRRYPRVRAREEAADSEKALRENVWSKISKEEFLKSVLARG